MAWKVERTESFDKWWKKEVVGDGNYKYHKQALADFQNTALPHHEVQVRIFQNASYECWVTRLPDKMRKKGKSGGFRVVLVLDLEEKVLYLQGIFRRGHLSYKGNGGKHDEAYAELLKNLAREFVEPN
jgi:mRNA-degrading endonuclease RelE of RelBE toxin-antitoxin system